MREQQLLVVDDDAVTRDLLKEIFEQEGFAVSLAADGEEALRLLAGRRFPLVLSDIRMLGLDGIGLLGRIRREHPETFVILMTGFGNLEGAVRAIQDGAYDYVSKPFRIEELKALVARAHKQWHQLREEGQALPAGPIRFEKSALIGRSPMIVEVYKSLARAALSGSSVLIAGESGTGKELVARAVHENSPRKERPFLVLGRGELAGAVLEGGLLQAGGGTLFLDEVDELDPGLQLRLLRFLQEAELQPGGPRVIAGTNRREPAELVREGGFREDLFYRLKVIEIRLPPLRERLEDLPDLVSHFVARFSERNGRRISHVSPEAMRMLAAYSWPGNVRELEHGIERAVAMSQSPVLFPEDFAGLFEGREAVAAQAAEPASGASLEEMEKGHILRVLRETSYNKSRASAVLGIDRATLYRKAQRYGIELSRGEV